MPLSRRQFTRAARLMGVLPVGPVAPEYTHPGQR